MEGENPWPENSHSQQRDESEVEEIDKALTDSLLSNAVTKRLYV